MSVSKTVRITLNITPEDYRELIRWADFAAAVVGVPRMSQQDVIRAMIHGTLSDQHAADATVKALRKEHM